jgi:hypothetical protein
MAARWQPLHDEFTCDAGAVIPPDNNSKKEASP